MAIPINRNPKFDWSKHDIENLRQEYYSIGLTEFMRKYKTGRGRVYNQLGYIPDHIKKALHQERTTKVVGNRYKKKLDILENTTKVARMYEKMMNNLVAPKYEGPWAMFIK